MDGCFRTLSIKEFIARYAPKDWVGEEELIVKCLIKKFIQYKNKLSEYFFETSSEAEVTALSMLVDLMFHRFWNITTPKLVIERLNRLIKTQLAKPESELTKYKLKHLNASLALFEQIQQRFKKLKTNPEVDFGSTDKLISIQF
jgi:hypothetical protein